MMKIVRSLAFGVASVLVFLSSDTILWMPFLLLAIFYAAVDYFGIDKASRNNSTTDIMEEFASQQLGVLGNYVIDSEESYGLFITLRGKKTFVDLREDEWLEQRKKHAKYLYENTETLEKNLNEFIKRHPEYESRQLTYIGLHSDNLNHGEVFWEPEGYTQLKGLECDNAL